MLTYYGRNTCNGNCGSMCCYIGFITLTEKEINEITEGYEKGDYLECYCSEIKEILEKGFIIDKWGKKYLDRKKGFGGYEDCMIMKRPCVFLHKENWSLLENGACMIWPHRPEICENTQDGFLGCKD